MFRIDGCGRGLEPWHTQVGGPWARAMDLACGRTEGDHRTLQRPMAHAAKSPASSAFIAPGRPSTHAASDSTAALPAALQLLQPPKALLQLWLVKLYAERRPAAQLASGATSQQGHREPAVSARPTPSGSHLPAAIRRSRTATAAMADVLPPPSQASPRALPKAQQGPAWPGRQFPSPLSTALSRPFTKGCHSSRNIHLGLDTFSPVNQNGSFEFDRVLKCGTVQKRTRKTKVRHPTPICLSTTLTILC
jgi:hypothetical protein